uniref:Cyclin-dependent kinase inhibitor domain-containing protein n=1 Tax=Hucho hucho TaxID=62062 RepID=A0A4W5LCF5_9TELE
MTNVQTPTGLTSPVAERATLPHRHTSICRNLFGPIDHDALNRELKAKLMEISEQDQRQWNFHFETRELRMGRNVSGVDACLLPGVESWSTQICSQGEAQRL